MSKSKEIKKKENNDENDEIIFELEDQNSSDIIKKLKSKNKQISSERQEYLEGWQRAKADLINARKNFDEEKGKLLKFATADLIIQLIPVLDSFEMIFNDKKWKEDPLLKEWIVGAQHIYSQFFSVLKENGVEETIPLDEKFNPVFHDSLEMVKVDNPEKDGIIVEVIQKGYLLNRTIVRPAKVKVGEYSGKGENT